MSVEPGDPFCWRSIGVAGDRSCPELAAAVHCRNCHFFTAAGRALMERPAPAGYLEEWAAVLADEKLVREAPSRSVLLFRLATEWLALDTSALVEIAEWKPPHRIPHRTGLIAGLVNIRGQLQLCVSLHRLLGIPEPDVPASRSSAGSPGSDTSRARLIVARGGDRTWVFGAEEVLGVHRVPADALTGVPLTVAEAERRFTRGLFEVEARWVGYLESDAVFAALEGLG